MSYALFWIEALITSLVWTAAMIACNARIRRKWISLAIIAFVIVVLPVVPLGAAAFATGKLKFHFGLAHNWFAYALSLLLTYCAGVAVLQFLARRRSAMGHEMSAKIWPRGRLLLGFLTAAAVTCMTLWNMDLEVRSQAQSLRTEAGAMLLSVSPPYLSDSQNAGILYQKAFARLLNDPLLHGPHSPLYERVPDENHSATAEILTRHQLTIKLLHRAAAIPEARFDHDYAHPGYMMLLPELTRTRQAGDLLWLDARYQQKQGRIAPAVSDVNAMFHLARAIGNEPLVVCGLFYTVSDGEAIHALMDLLPGVSRPEQLAALDIGDGAFDASLVKRDLEGEKALGLATFSDLINTRIDFSTLMGIVASKPSNPDISVLDYPLISMFSRIFILPDDIAAYRQTYEKLPNMAAQPYFKNPPASQIQDEINHSGLVTMTIVPAGPKFELAVTTARAMHLSAQTAVAMTRYRLDHGALPGSLDRLVPDYLDEVPSDPFDGKPLRLSHKGADWIIYSVGPDGKDDGGTPYVPKTKSGDISVTLKERQ